jgi:hypothetical protein
MSSYVGLGLAQAPAIYDASIKGQMDALKLAQAQAQQEAITMKMLEDSLLQPMRVGSAIAEARQKLNLDYKPAEQKNESVNKLSDAADSLTKDDVAAYGKIKFGTEDKMKKALQDTSTRQGFIKDIMSAVRSGKFVPPSRAPREPQGEFSQPLQLKLAEPVPQAAVQMAVENPGQPISITPVQDLGNEQIVSDAIPQLGFAPQQQMEFMKYALPRLKSDVQVDREKADAQTAFLVEQLRFKEGKEDVRTNKKIEHEQSLNERDNETKIQDSINDLAASLAGVVAAQDRPRGGGAAKDSIAVKQYAKDIDNFNKMILKTRNAMNKPAVLQKLVDLYKAGEVEPGMSGLRDGLLKNNKELFDAARKNPHVNWGSVTIQEPGSTRVKGKGSSGSFGAPEQTPTPTFADVQKSIHGLLATKANEISPAKIEASLENYRQKKIITQQQKDRLMRDYGRMFKGK